jgi:hypothetical protein
LLGAAGANRVGERNDPFGLVDYGILDEYAVDDDRPRPGLLSLGKSVNHLASEERFVRVGPVDAMAPRYLVWMNADPPPVTKRS